MGRFFRRLFRHIFDFFVQTWSGATERRRSSRTPLRAACTGPGRAPLRPPPPGAPESPALCCLFFRFDKFRSTFNGTKRARFVKNKQTNKSHQKSNPSISKVGVCISNNEVMLQENIRALKIAIFIKVGTQWLVHYICYIPGTISSVETLLRT